MPFLLKLLRYFLVGSAQRVIGLQLSIAAILALGGYLAWRACEVEICSQKTYWINLENVRVFDPPIWIPDNFIQEALEYRPPARREQPLNSLDPNLKNELLAAFNSHPWVDRVETIAVYYPGRVDLRVKFKRPIAVVDPTPLIDEELLDFEDGEDFHKRLNKISDFDFASATLPRAEETAPQYIVDANGYRLPDVYFQENKRAYSEYIKVQGVHSTPVSNFGPSVDPQIVEAAAFVHFLLQNDAQNALEINRIIASKKDGAAKGTYTLITANNRAVIFWGYFTPATPNAAESQENATPAIETETTFGTPRESFQRQQEKMRKLLETAKRERWLETAPNASKRLLDLSGISKKKQKNTEDRPQKATPSKSNKSQENKGTAPKRPS